MRRMLTVAVALVMALLAVTVSAAPAEQASANGMPETAVSVRVTDEVMRAGDYLFRVLEDGTAELVEYAGMDEVGDIPGEIAGYRVTAIGERCFSDQGNMNFYTDEYPDFFREGIRTVTVPEGVVSIGGYAFESCFNLVAVSLPDSLRRIGEGAFDDCGALMKIELPEGLTELGAYAFRGCGSLTRISLPESLQALGANPFAGCAHLAEIGVPASHPFLRWEDGMLFDTKENSLICATKAAWGSRAALPEGLRIIGESALAGAPYQEISLPESLTRIGSYAFSNCAELRELAIPAGVLEIGDNPVMGCLRLQALTVAEGRNAFSVRDDALFDDREGRLIACLETALISEKPQADRQDPDAPPEEIEADGVRMRRLAYVRDLEDKVFEPAVSYTVPDGIRTVGAYAFYSNRISAVTLPDSVEEIGAGAFEDCVNLTDCVIPARVVSIPDRLFKGCTALEEVTIPDGIASVGAYAFYESGVEEVRLPAAAASVGPYAFSNCERLTKVGLSDAMTVIPKGAFSFSPVEDITIPAGITEIGEQAFAGCSRLTKLVLPEGITSIPAFCFYDSTIAEINIPDGVTYIGDHAFRMGEYTGSNLESIIIPESVRFIGNYAFSGGLFTEITLPAGLAAAGRNVFNYCYNLKELHLPDGLKLITDGMFFNCAVESVEIPDSVSSIGRDAFSNCNGLQSVRMPSGRTEIEGNPFAGCDELRTVTLAADHTDLRLQDGLLIDVKDERVIACLPALLDNGPCIIPGGIRVIGSGAFANMMPSFSEIILPDGLRVIEDDAFAQTAVGLKNIRLPEGLEEIGDCAFDGIESLALPETLKKIGAGALSGIREVRIPASVERIGRNAFGEFVKRIEFANGPVYLEGAPFTYCTPEIVLPEDHPTLELRDGNLYGREDGRVIAVMSDSPIRRGTAEIAEGALMKPTFAVPESVELIRFYGADWYHGLPDSVYAVPGSPAEAFFASGLGST